VLRAPAWNLATCGPGWPQAQPSARSPSNRDGRAPRERRPRPLYASRSGGPTLLSARSLTAPRPTWALRTGRVDAGADDAHEGTSRRDSTASARWVRLGPAWPTSRPRFQAGARNTKASRLSGTAKVVTNTVSTLT